MKNAVYAFAILLVIGVYVPVVIHTIINEIGWEFGV